MNILFDELYYKDNLFKLIYDNSNNNYTINNNSNNNNNDNNNNDTSSNNNNNSNNNNYTSNTNDNSSNVDRYYLNIHYLQWYYSNNITYDIEQWLCQPPVHISKLTYKYIPISSTTKTTTTNSAINCNNCGNSSSNGINMNVYDMLLALEPGSLLPP